MVCICNTADSSDTSCSSPASATSFFHSVHNTTEDNSLPRNICAITTETIKGIKQKQCDFSVLIAKLGWVEFYWPTIGVLLMITNDKVFPPWGRWNCDAQKWKRIISFCSLIDKLQIPSESSREVTLLPTIQAQTVPLLPQLASWASYLFSTLKLSRCLHGLRMYSPCSIKYIAKLPWAVCTCWALTLRTR